MEIDKQTFNIPKNKKDDFCGIYCIYNSKYFYIGQSIHVRKRFKQHQNSIRKNKHENILMQRVFNKYKDTDPLRFKELIACDPNDLNYFEEYYFNKISKEWIDKTAMNLDPCGKAGDYIISSKHKSESHIGKPNTWKQVKYVQLDLQGNLIKVWDSLSSASKFYNKNINPRKKLSIGYQWQTYKDWEKNPKGKVVYRHTIHSTIKQFDLQGNFIQEFENINSAINFIGLKSKSSLVACLNGTNKTCKGFLWSYSNTPKKYNNLIDRTNCRKPVKQFTIDGKYIKTFNSINEASEILGIPIGSIKNNLKGSQKQAGGFIWKR